MKVDYSPVYEVVEALAHRHGIEVDITRLHGETRQSHLIFQRALIARLLRIKGFGSSDIGRMMHRTHGAVINLWNYTRKKQARDPRYTKIITAEQARLR